MKTIIYFKPKDQKIVKIHEALMNQFIRKALSKPFFMI